MPTGRSGQADKALDRRSGRLRPDGGHQEQRHRGDACPGGTGAPRPWTATTDILSDLGPACTGTIGIAPSANLNPDRRFPSLFEPVHGSAPDIYGQGIANPIAMIWSGALMLDFLGHRGAHDAIVGAIEQVLRNGPRTPDLGGGASTVEIGKAVAQALA
jgi:hypothetical protein